MRAFVSMVRANLKMTLRNRVSLFWLLVFPSIFILLFGFLARGSGYLDFLVPGILAMSIMNGGIITLSGTFVTMRERGILRRVRATPFPIASFVFARILTQIVVAFLQAAILLGTAKVVFDLKIVGGFLDVAVFIALGSLAFLTIGFFVASVSRKRGSAVALAGLVSLPMLFMAGVFFPVDQAPTWVQYIARALPLSYLADGLRQVTVYGVSLSTLWPDMLALAVTAILGFLLAARFFRWEPKAS